MSDPTAVDSGAVRETAELPVIPPSIPRDDVASDGRVGAVAYPYRAIEATIAMERLFLSDREDTFFVSVDRSRRIALRADSFPETESMAVEDVLVLPVEVDDEQTDEMARESVFKWTLRKYSLNKPRTWSSCGRSTRTNCSGSPSGRAATSSSTACGETSVRSSRTDTAALLAFLMVLGWNEECREST
ncbi:hypothetical protein ACFQH6_09570 [Halobacteriaceae archaeon GCM10025711]